MEGTDKVAGIDVHKSRLAVVVTDAAGEGESPSSAASGEPLQANWGIYGHGWRSLEYARPSWNRRRNTASRCGRR